MASIHPNVPCYLSKYGDIYRAECVHLGTSMSRVKEAEAGGVQPVSASVMNGAEFHMNFGACIDALK